MTLSTFACLEEISQHSSRRADAARRNPAATVDHRPGRTVADLVQHVTEVHWFWRTIVAEQLDEPPPESLRPPRAADDELIDVFLDGAHQLVSVLGDADQSAPCWTWAIQKDVAFVTRHQVQEVAVHHWDAEYAVQPHRAAGHGGPSVARWGMSEAAAIDAIEEFLTFSVSSDADPAVRPYRRWTAPSGSAPARRSSSTPRAG